MQGWSLSWHKHWYGRRLLDFGVTKEPGTGSNKPHMRSRKYTHTHKYHNSWWCHDMELRSALLALCWRNPPVTGVFPSKGALMQSVDFFPVVSLGMLLNQRSNRRLFVTPWRSCDVTTMLTECPYICICTEWPMSSSWLQVSLRHIDPGHQQSLCWLNCDNTIKWITLHKYIPKHSHETPNIPDR